MLTSPGFFFKEANLSSTALRENESHFDTPPFQTSGTLVPPPPPPLFWVVVVLRANTVANEEMAVLNTFGPVLINGRCIGYVLTDDS